MERITPNGLLRFKSVQYWMRSLRTDGNRKKCLKAFPKFVRWLQRRGEIWNPDEIVKSRADDLKLPLDNPKRYRWEDLTKFFYHELYDKFVAEDKSTWTARTKLSAIQSFFSHHRLNLRFKRGELKIASTKREKRVPKIEDIRVMYEVAESWRDKALLLTLAQTGMSEVDVGSVDIEDVIDDLSKPPLYYERRRTKTRHKGGLIQTCFGSEACEAISMMLKLRGTPHTGPLFISHKGARMTSRFINEAIKRLAEYAELEDFQTKDLRDFFGDALDHAGVAGKFKEVMMGRVPWGAEKYYRISKYTIIDGYTKTYQYLRINAHARPKEQLEQVAIEMKRLMAIVASENPRVELAKYVDELRQVSPSIVGPTSFKELLKRALETE